MSAPARIVAPPFAAEQVLQWSARATGAFARVAALACLIGSTGAFARHSEIGPAGISIGDKIAVLTFLGAACFWRRGRGLIALFGGVVTLAAAWSGGYLAQPATRSVVLGFL